MKIEIRPPVCPAGRAFGDTLGVGRDQASNPANCGRGNGRLRGCRTALSVADGWPTWVDAVAPAAGRRPPPARYPAGSSRARPVHRPTLGGLPIDTYVRTGMTRLFRSEGLVGLSRGCGRWR